MRHHRQLTLRFQNTREPGSRCFLTPSLLSLTRRLAYSGRSARTTVPPPPPPPHPRRRPRQPRPGARLAPARTLVSPADRVLVRSSVRASFQVDLCLTPAQRCGDAPNQTLTTAARVQHECQLDNPLPSPPAGSLKLAPARGATQVRNRARRPSTKPCPVPVRRQRCMSVSVSRPDASIRG